MTGVTHPTIALTRRCLAQLHSCQCHHARLALESTVHPIGRSSCARPAPRTRQRVHAQPPLQRVPPLEGHAAEEGAPVPVGQHRQVLVQLGASLKEVCGKRDTTHTPLNGRGPGQPRGFACGAWRGIVQARAKMGTSWAAAWGRSEPGVGREPHVGARRSGTVQCCCTGHGVSRCRTWAGAAQPCKQAGAVREVPGGKLGQQVQAGQVHSGQGQLGVAPCCTVPLVPRGNSLGNACAPVPASSCSRAPPTPAPMFWPAPRASASGPHLAPGHCKVSHHGAAQLLHPALQPQGTR